MTTHQRVLLRRVDYTTFRRPAHPVTLPTRKFVSVH